MTRLTRVLRMKIHPWKLAWHWQNPVFNRKYMGVSKNSGTPKSSILIGFSIINHPFWGTILFGNTHIFIHGGCSIVMWSLSGRVLIWLASIGWRVHIFLPSKPLKIEDDDLPFLKVGYVKFPGGQARKIPQSRSCSLQPRSTYCILIHRILQPRNLT